MIELCNLSTGYNKNNLLLQKFNYSFDNKIYGILGESGSGKTTLLRTIAGLVKPIEGEVIVNGELVKRPYKNNIYMMHQNYTSFDWLTCLDNILITKRIKGKVDQHDILNAKKILNAVGLETEYKKYPQQLSGGMRQRLALARTLFTNPEIILMDEPLSALDEKTRKQMQGLIIENHKRTMNTIIMVTHSKEEAKKMCDVIIEIKNKESAYGI